MRYQYVQRESRYLFLPLFPAVFKENISVFNFLFLELVISKFKFAEYIRKASFDRYSVGQSLYLPETTVLA